MCLQERSELSEKPPELGSEALHHYAKVLQSRAIAPTEESPHPADCVCEFLLVGDRLCTDFLLSLANGSTRKFSSAVVPWREISTMSSQKPVSSRRERVRTPEPSAMSTRPRPLVRDEIVTLRPYLFSSWTRIICHRLGCSLLSKVSGA